LDGGTQGFGSVGQHLVAMDTLEIA
jgi:hypothetical protein